MVGISRKKVKLEEGELEEGENYFASSDQEPDKTGVDNVIEKGNDSHDVLLDSSGQIAFGDTL